jgi:TPR repeat protein
MRATPFEGDVAIARLRERPDPGAMPPLAPRERPSLDPVVMPPPPDLRGSSIGLLARLAGAIGLAALAAFFIAGTSPLKGVVKAESEAGQPPSWSRFAALGEATRRSSAAQAADEAAVPLAERFAAAAADLAPVRTAQTPPVQIAVLPDVPPQAAETRPRALDRDEIANLHRRSEALIGQGDIAGARLLLTRAAEAGDARAALALGMIYDAANLTRLGVRGIAPDAAQARLVRQGGGVRLE